MANTQVDGLVLALNVALNTENPVRSRAVHSFRRYVRRYHKHLVPLLSSKVPTESVQQDPTINTTNNVIEDNGMWEELELTSKKNPTDQTISHAAPAKSRKANRDTSDMPPVKKLISSTPQDVLYLMGNDIKKLRAFAKKQGLILDYTAKGLAFIKEFQMQLRAAYFAASDLKEAEDKEDLALELAVEDANKNALTLEDEDEEDFLDYDEDDDTELSEEDLSELL